MLSGRVRRSLLRTAIFSRGVARAAIVRECDASYTIAVHNSFPTRTSWFVYLVESHWNILERVKSQFSYTVSCNVVTRRRIFGIFASTGKSKPWSLFFNGRRWSTVNENAYETRVRAPGFHEPVKVSLVSRQVSGISGIFESEMRSKERPISPPTIALRVPWLLRRVTHEEFTRSSVHLYDASKNFPFWRKSVHSCSKIKPSRLRVRC